MSEEEKKAIKVIKHRIGRLKCELEIENEYKDDEPRIFYLMEQINSSEKILNLVEKQQKEIERLKEYEGMFKVYVIESE